MNADELAKILQEAFERMGITGPFKDFKDNLDDVNSALSDEEKARTKQERLLKSTNEAFGKLDDSIKKGRKKIVDLGSSVEHLDDLLLDLDDSAEKLELEFRRNALASQYLTAQYKKAGVQFLKSAGDAFISGGINMTKNFVGRLQDGASGISLASGLMTDALDMQQKQIRAASQAMETMGQVGLSLAKTGKGKGLAGAVIGAGMAMDYMSEKMTDLAKFGIEILSKEVEKTVKAFNDSSASGAVFGRGMDDLRFYADRAGLTVDQFAGAIKNSNALLAESGYTVADAAKIIANVTSQFRGQVGKSGLTLQREMLNLGFGFQEQAEITAQVVAGMKKTGTGQLSRAEIAGATADLAKDMRKVADIMGEEYKAKQEAAKKATEQYAFYEMLVKRARETNDPTLVDRVRLSFTKMSESEVRARMQYAISGGAVSDFTANITGAADGAGDFNNAIFNEVNPSLERLSRSSDELHDSYMRGGNETRTAIAVAGGMIGAYGDTVAELGELQQLAFKSNTENSEKAKGAVEELAGAQGGLQDAVIGAEIAAQDLRTALQETLTPAIKKFGIVANEILDGVKKRVDSLGMGSGSATPKSGESTKLSEYGGMGALGLYGIAGVLGLAGLVTGGATLPAAGYAFGAANALGIGSTAAGAAGFADGGIADGPTSGYSQMLHGTEAVVPLPDNRNIPVSLDSSTLTAAINQNSSILNAILEEMKDGNSISSQIVQNTY